jgi:(2Fe-2S) ferredoxin
MCFGGVHVKQRTEAELMMKRDVSPYVTHVFVCTHDRGGEKKSCGDEHSPEIRSKLKSIVKDKGWKGRVRISSSGCMGLCNRGPNVVLYPQKILFTGVSPDDTDAIAVEIQNIMEG